VGLDLVVGVVADCIADGDQDSLSYFREEMGRINAALRAAALRDHREPEHLTPEQIYRTRIGNHDTLPYLLRIAFHLGMGRSPEPADAEGGWGTDRDYRGFCTDPTAYPGGFKHLLWHAEDQGYYVPVRFSEVVFPDDSIELESGPIGSSFALLAELEEIAAWLEVPTSLDPENEEIFERPTQRATGWRRFAIEAGVCLRMRNACEASLATGAAIVLC